MTRCKITCAEPGCLNPIFYDSDDKTVPLYCCRHRKATGRHAAVRVLEKPEEKVELPVEVSVVMLCPAMPCHHRQIVPMSRFRSGNPVLCEKCGRKMNYHKEADADMR